MSVNIDLIKQRLLARKRELEVELQNLAESRAGVEAESVQDPLDQAIKSSIEDLSISLEENGRDEYARIIEALGMLEAGTYGFCIDCEQPISVKRLELYPNATRCISCQENHEASA